MSDFFENNQEIKEQLPDDSTVNEVSLEETIEEESTVFSSPIEHKDKAPKNANKKRLVSIVAACLAVAILIGGTISVIKLIPELKDDEVASSVFEDISLIDKDSSTFTSVKVTNTNGTFEFIKKEITTTTDEGKTEAKSYWGVEEIDISKMSTDSMNSVISSAASITATREITTKTKAECGLEKPPISVSVEDATNGSFGFAIGDQSPDGLGYYFALDGSDKIYVVPASEFSDFEFKLIDLSDKTAIPSTMFTTDTSENKEEDGTYAYFDSLTVSGKLYGDTIITIENNKANGASAEVTPYIITTPTKRYAKTENLTSLINLFSNSTVVSGNYAFDVNDKIIKEFGLDNPDSVVTLTINGESKYFKISLVDDTYCAVIYDGATMIRKANISSFPFLSLNTEDFYNENPFMYSLTDLSALKLVDGEEKIKFDISYTEDESETKTFHILANGKEIVASDFQNFYADFVATQCNSFEVKETSDKPVSTITFTFNSGSKTVVKFYKISETEYQYSVDDTPMGRVTSSAYKKILRNIKAQAKTAESE